MTHTTTALADLTLAASVNVRAGRPASAAQLAAGGASDLIIANAATRTVANLRAAHAELGAARLEAVLGTLPQTALRAVLARLDAGRPNVVRIRKPELLCLLLCIAEGGNTWAEADAIQSARLGGWAGFDFRADFAAA